jgi:hypothetical protein
MSELKGGVPCPQMRNRPAGHGTADRKADFKEPDQNAEAGASRQERSTLELQIFCLAHRLAISAPMAAALAPWVYGSWRS